MRMPMAEPEPVAELLHVAPVPVVLHRRVVDLRSAAPAVAPVPSPSVQLQVPVAPCHATSVTVVTH